MQPDCHPELMVLERDEPADTAGSCVWIDAARQQANGIMGSNILTPST